MIAALVFAAQAANAEDPNMLYCASENEAGGIILKIDTTLDKQFSFKFYPKRPNVPERATKIDIVWENEKLGYVMAEDRPLLGLQLVAMWDYKDKFSFTILNWLDGVNAPKVDKENFVCTEEIPTELNIIVFD